MTRRDLSACFLLLVLALVPRLGYVFFGHANELTGDEIEYDALAEGLARTGAYTSQPGFSPALYSPRPYEPTAVRPPAFPAFLAAAYVAGGHSPKFARCLLSFVAALGVTLVFLLALKIYQDRKVAWISAIVWAVWPASVYYIGTHSAMLGPENLLIVTTLVGLLWLSRPFESKFAYGTLAAGVAFGVAALIRFNLIIIIPMVCLWLWLPGVRQGRRKTAVATVVLVAATIGVMFPWVLRVYLRLGVPVVTTQTDPLFFGNNEMARGSQNSENGRIFHVIAPHAGAKSLLGDDGEDERTERFKAAYEQTKQFSFLEQRHPGFIMRSEAEKAAIYRSEALAYILENKRRMLWLLYRKIVLFWIPVHEVAGGRSGYSWAYGLMLPFFAVGAAEAVFRRRQRALLLIAPLLACFITAVVVFANPRYRYPAEPLMIIMAAAGAHLVASSLNRWRKGGSGSTVTTSTH